MCYPIRSPLALFVALFLVVLCTGCGGGIKPRGEVKFEGKPLEDGTITFVKYGINGPEGLKRSAPIQNGKYELNRGIPVGYYLIEIDSWQDGPEGKVNIIPRLYNTKTLLTMAPDRGDPDNLNFALIKNVVDSFGNP